MGRVVVEHDGQSTVTIAGPATPSGPSMKDALEVISKAAAVATLASVAITSMILFADYQRLSPFIAGIVEYSDFFRALPQIFSILMLLAVATLWLSGLVALGSVMTARGALGASAILAFGLFGFRDELHSFGFPRALWKILLFFAVVMVVASAPRALTELPRFAEFAIICMGLLLSAALWLALFHHPLAAAPHLRDRICAEACRDTQILRVYSAWIVHRPQPERLEFAKRSEITSFSIAQEPTP